MRKERWREAALEKAGWRCERCGTTDRLEVHHKQPPRLGGGNEPENLEALCLPCHPRGGCTRKIYPRVKSIRFSVRDDERIRRLAARLETDAAEVVRRAVREMAKREGVE